MACNQWERCSGHHERCSSCGCSCGCGGGSVRIGITRTGEAGTEAKVANCGTDCDAILEFTIPRGEDGEDGKDGKDGRNGRDGKDGKDGRNGENGKDGKAATITIGKVETTDRCENVRVTNSGTSTNAVLNFVLPCQKEGKTDIVKAVNENPQNTGEEKALTFAATPIAFGDALSHANGASKIVVKEKGVYQAVFNGIVYPNMEIRCPVTVSLALFVNKVLISGSTVVHYFTDTDDRTNMTFTAYFTANSVPVDAEVVFSSAGFRVSDAAFTIIKIRDI